MFQCAAFAFGVLTDINGYYPYTGNSAHLSQSLALPYHMRPPG